MRSLFNESDRAALLARLDSLQPGAQRQWGKMNPPQMLCHCAVALEAATGERPLKQLLIGRILAPLVRRKSLGDSPFPRNSPTHPTFVISDERDFTAERSRLLERIEQFVKQGPDEAARHVHTFFGRLTGQEWGRLMHKHLDHHLSQFGV
jgi:hypothetical protein